MLIEVLWIAVGYALVILPARGQSQPDYRPESVSIAHPVARSEGHHFGKPPEVIAACVPMPLSLSKVLRGRVTGLPKPHPEYASPRRAARQHAAGHPAHGCESVAPFLRLVSRSWLHR